jgi:DNA topoisomerase-1
MYRLLGREPPFDVKHYKSGITRVKVKGGFIYYYIKNKKQVSNKDLKRILKLKIPPAWTNVWISSDPTTPIQATGLDKKGTKQYRYHEQHIKKAEQEKFIRMYDFIVAIPKLDRTMKKHSKLNIYDKNRVIVSMLTIIRELHLRVGKEVYARKHKSYGATSLRKVHMKIQNNVIKLRFKGKSKKRLSYTLYHPELAKHLKMLLKLEGDRLFQYIDTNDKIKRVTDVDLNKYIQKYMGKKFTVKDFRTYSANRYFVRSILHETKKRNPKNKKAIKKSITSALKSVIYYMRHTMSVSKKSYVMHFVINLYENNPKYFVDKLDDDPDDVLLDLLKLYRKKVIKI